MATDRREAIAAAFADAEDAADEVVQTSIPAETAVDHGDGLGAGETVNEEVAEGKPAVPAAPKPGVPAETQGDAKPVKTYATDKPPQSWRPAQKAKWAALEPDMRQEIVRRERETERVLGETAQARSVAQAFQQVVQPFMARIQSQGVHPMTAIQELLKADHILVTAPKAQRAQFMAKLIKDYDIDVMALDDALSGSQTATNPVQSEVERLLQERLAPFQQFIQNQNQESERVQQRTAAELQTNIEAMASDPKFAEFDNVREDMADLIDLSAKKGVYLTLEQAYSRAIAMNPEVSQRVQQQLALDQKSASARAAHARAQKALRASSSVGGAPSIVATGATVVNDRRATIAAAFDQLEGR